MHFRYSISWWLYLFWFSWDKLAILYSGGLVCQIEFQLPFTSESGIWAKNTLFNLHSIYNLLNVSMYVYMYVERSDEWGAQSFGDGCMEKGKGKGGGVSRRGWRGDRENVTTMILHQYMHVAFSSFTCTLIDWMIDWLLAWLIDWLADWLTDIID